MFAHSVSRILAAVLHGAAVCAILLSAGGGAGLADAPSEAEGYRMGAYRAPTPAGLAGAETVTTETARQLWESGNVLFIDVLPRPPKPANLPEGTVWRDRPRHGVPGSVWLPNVGFGVLNENVDTYFRDNLARLAQSRPEAPILFYCLADCWMSWNAAKRALEYGYKNIYWYPAGTDGWVAAGGNLEKLEPVPLAP